MSHESSEQEIVSAKCQDMESRWKAILGLEASIDVLRISMEGVRTEMEASTRRMLTGSCMRMMSPLFASSERLGGLPNWR